MKYIRNNTEEIEITTKDTGIVLKDLAANSTYKIMVKMKTDFTYYAQFGEGDYSTFVEEKTLPIERTFQNELLEELKINDLRNDAASKKQNNMLFDGFKIYPEDSYMY